ncbi:MAG: hypothetical protein ACXV5H_08375 [Halobacteriota archaeon]
MAMLIRSSSLRMACLIHVLNTRMQKFNYYEQMAAKMRLTDCLKENSRTLKVLLVALGILYLFGSTLAKHNDYWWITNISMAFAVDPLHFMAETQNVAYPPTFYALQGAWLKLGSFLFHYNLTINYDLQNSTFYSYRLTRFGLFPFWGMVPILAALFLLVGASYTVLKNKWLSLLCFGPITFVSVILMGQIDVVSILFIFVSLILMQRALKAEKYFLLLLLAYLGLGVAVQFKTYGGLLLPAYLIYTIALTKDKKLDLTKSFFMFVTCLATFLVAALLVWAPYPGWFSVIILHGKSNYLFQIPSLLFHVPIWIVGYIFILCYMAVRVLGKPERALDDRYFVYYNFAIVAWFFIAVFTNPQWWMFLTPVALLALDKFQNNSGILFYIGISTVYLFYPMYWNWGSLLPSYYLPVLAPAVATYAFVILAALLLFWILALKREFDSMGRRVTSADQS